jgi:hypothetical protein
MTLESREQADVIFAKEKTLYLQQHDGKPVNDLHWEVRQWIVQHPTWYLRAVPPGTESAPWGFSLPLNRQATADEIATEIVNDPRLRQALTFLESPSGQSIEKAITGLWLSPWQATLLAAALTQAWKIVLDQNRPWWQRFDVLVGTLAGIAFIGLMIMASRDSR